ncbi:MAG: RimK family alpha-L-glutamate ligase [Candidatus Nezhaarchaeales archaeon]
MFIGVIHGLSTPDHPSSELLKALRDRGVDADLLTISKITAHVGAKRSFSYRGSQLKLDGAFVRSLGSILTADQLVRRISLLSHMEDEGVTLMNPLDPLLNSRDKYRSLCILERSGLRVPKTIITEDLKVAYEWVKKVGQVVIKPEVGSRGYGAVKTDDPEVAFRILKTLASFRQPLYIQEYVAKPERDIRAFVVGDEVIAAIYRVASPSEWRTNVAQGGKAKPLKVTAEVSEVALKATSCLGLWYSGVDIIEAAEGYMVLEVNGSPEWAGLQEATGVRPAPIMVDFLISKLKS